MTSGTGYDTRQWADFAAAVAAAAAALTGLLFIAVSINLKVILSGSRITSRAALALVMLVAPVFLALCLLVPAQGTTAIGVELVVAAAALAAILGWLIRPGQRNPAQHLSWWVATSAVPTTVLVAGSALAGVGTATTSLGGLYWMAPTIGVALLSGLVNAWVLLVEILR